MDTMVKIPVFQTVLAPRFAVDDRILVAGDNRLSAGTAMRHRRRVWRIWAATQARAVHTGHAHKFVLPTSFIRSRIMWSLSSFSNRIGT